MSTSRLGREEKQAREEGRANKKGWAERIEKKRIRENASGKPDEPHERLSVEG